jgi:hypothetical protein
VLVIAPDVAAFVIGAESVVEVILTGRTTVDPVITVEVAGVTDIVPLIRIAPEVSIVKACIVLGEYVAELVTTPAKKLAEAGGAPPTRAMAGLVLDTEKLPLEIFTFSGTVEVTFTAPPAILTGITVPESA